MSTFLLNLFVVRQVAPEIFGIGNFHLQLFMNIIFLLSREGFRRAITRYELRNKYVTIKKIIPHPI